MRVGEGSDGDALATTREEGCGVLTCAPPSDRDFPTKNPRRISRAGAATILDDVNMPVICPTRLGKNSFLCEGGRIFTLFIGRITWKFLPLVRHEPSEEIVFYAFER